MTSPLKENLSSPQAWLRLLWMILFAIFQYLVRFVILLVAIFQFVTVLITGKPNARVLKFGYGLSTYSYQIYCFLTYNTEVKPYPFSEWPSAIKELPKSSSSNSSD